MVQGVRVGIFNWSHFEGHLQTQWGEREVEHEAAQTFQPFRQVRAVQGRKFVFVTHRGRPIVAREL